MSSSGIIRNDKEIIDHLGSENARLTEIIDFMRNHYSPFGSRSCALCVYDDDRLVRYCAMHRWHDTATKILASRAADPADPANTTYLSDEELAAWIDRAGIRMEARVDTYLRLVIDELRERRDAEAMFVDVDLKLQGLADCEACADDTHGTDHDHRAIVKRWQIARTALCALARIHRGYLRFLNAPDGPDGDPR